MSTPTTAQLRARVFEYVIGLDRVLGPLGHPPLAPTVREELRRWLVLSPARTWLLRKGRRIGASTILCPRLILAWIVTVVPHIHLPPGEFVTIGLVSIKRGESANRISQITAHFDAVGISYDVRESAGEIQLLDFPVKVRVLTRNWRTAVGETIGFLWCDELARWESGDDYEVDAESVLTTLFPALLTIPASLQVLPSAPWGLTDAHAVRFAKGNTPTQCVSHIPSWLGNPTLSEEMLRAESSSEAVFLREFAGYPSSTVEHVCFDVERSREARRRRIPSWFVKVGVSHTCIDMSAGHEGGDPAAWISCSLWQEDPYQVHQLVAAKNDRMCAIRKSHIDGTPMRRADRPPMRPILRVEFADRLIPPFHSTWDSMRLAKRILFDGARFNPPNCTQHVHMDQFSEHAYKGIFKELRAQSHYHPLSSVSKGAAVALVRQWIDDGTIAIDDSPAADSLLAELEHFQEIMTSGGNFKYSAPSGLHDDLVCCLLQAALSVQSDTPWDRIGWQAARGALKEYRRTET